MNTLNINKQELLYQINRCNELISSGVFQSYSTLRQSTFIEIMTHLSDILNILNKKHNRINLVKDIETSTDKKISDITSLVFYSRNAACHTDAIDKRIIGQKSMGIKSVFNIVFGKNLNALKIGDYILGCEYEDDMAFYYGDSRIYLRRHIVRLLNELPNLVKKL